MTTRRAVLVRQDYWADCTQCCSWPAVMMVRAFIVLIPLVLVVVIRAARHKASYNVDWFLPPAHVPGIVAHKEA